jgi:hypothetical protein
MKKLLIAVSLLGLIACSGGGGGSSTSSTPGTPGTPGTVNTFPGKFRLTSQVSQQQSLKMAMSLDGATGLVGSDPTAQLHLNQKDASPVTLPDGKVLLFGSGDRGGSDRIEYFDPTDEKFYLLDTKMQAPREAPRALLMGDGLIYIFGGIRNGDNTVVEIFDPATGQITSTTCNFLFTDFRDLRPGDSRAYRVSGTEILYLGGNGLDPHLINVTDMSVKTTNFTNGVNDSLRYDSVQGPDGTVYFHQGNRFLKFDYNKLTFEGKCYFDNDDRFGITMVPLKNGDVVIAGGAVNDHGVLDQTKMTSSVYIYHPADDPGGPDSTGGFVRFKAIAQMPQARWHQLGTVLPNGRVLMAGGQNAGSAVDEQLIFDPQTGSCGYTGKMITNRAFHSMVTLPNGRVLILGGSEDLGTDVNFAKASNKVEIFEPEANVYINSTSKYIPAGASYQFSVEYKGTVTWTCDQGTIDQTGLWTAPWTYTSNAATITATSTTDSTKYAYTIIQIVDPTSIMRLYGKAEVALNEENQYTARIYYINPSTVTWTVDADSKNATMTSDGILKCLVAGSYKIRATSTVDDRYYGEATITAK